MTEKSIALPMRWVIWFGFGSHWPGLTPEAIQALRRRQTQVTRRFVLPFIYKVTFVGASISSG